MRLKDEVAVITGAGSGIGRASAILFASESARVVVADINPISGTETVKLIKDTGGEASFVQIDAGKIYDMERMIKFTVDAYGKLNILFNNAGIAGPGNLEGVKEEEWDETVNVLNKGAFFACQFAVPEMRRAGGGSILFTSSVSGLVGSPFSPTYSMCKGAIILLTKSLALLLAKDNIRVNCICPGPVDTPILRASLGRKPGVDVEVAKQAFVATVPLARTGRPEEIAYTALFLASDESSYITGIALPVDGGITAR